MNLEDQTTEYKREYTDEIKKTVIAFANTRGGKIYIGVNDDLSVEGINLVDEVLLQSSNMIRDSIKPDITMFIDYKVEVLEEKEVVVIEVQKGTSVPYYLASKGIRSEGVFVRQGASSVPATETAILNMIKETSGDNYEAIRSLNQSLTFESCENEFAVANVKFEIEQMKTLHFIGSDGLYSNLALLLSEQCTHTIKIAVFEGINKTVFKDRCEFTGSLFKQLRDCFDFLNRYNRVRAEIEGLTRIDKRDYPAIAIREALLNAVVHRDYSFSSSTLISVFDNRIEMVTVGGLLRGITMEDMMLGVSILRNKNLANVFYRLHLIEAYGTGVIKMVESYLDYPEVKPLIETTDNAFRITLYNTNEMVELPSKVEEVELNKSEEKIIELLKVNSSIVRKDVEELLSISQTMATLHIKSLMVKEKICKKGQGKNTVYLYKK